VFSGERKAFLLRVVNKENIRWCQGCLSRLAKKKKEEHEVANVGIETGFGNEPVIDSTMTEN